MKLLHATSDEEGSIARALEILRTESTPLEMNQRTELIKKFPGMVRKRMADLKALRVDNQQKIESDLFYRFYHSSFKTWWLQPWIAKSVITFHQIVPGMRLNDYYSKIAIEGLSEQFNDSFNREWTKHARPIVEAAFHTGTFIDALIFVGESADESTPRVLSPEWGVALYLWNLRQG